jgi:hypothetical protein
MLIITNKFFKNKLLIADVNIWKSKNWAVELLRYLQLCNWDVLKVIISNRDAKFRFELWRWIFKILKIDLFINTAYHSQTKRSKWTNQSNNRNRASLFFDEEFRFIMTRKIIIFTAEIHEYHHVDKIFFKSNFLRI